VSSFKQLPLSDLREHLPKFKRQVQLGMKRIAATYYGQVVGFLVPLKDLQRAEEDNAIINTEEMSLSEFKQQLTQCWERLQIATDCIYVTYHTRRAVAFVSPRFMNYLSIPISEVASKLLALDSELIEVDGIFDINIRVEANSLSEEK